MPKPLTIVTYHYVRELQNSRFSEIKGLEVNLFKEQLKYIKKHYQIVTMEDVIESVKDNQELPKNAILLSFDDAYSDHFNYVLPLLDEIKAQGSFFAPVRAITEHEVLDVNKIHFILASVSDKAKIVREIYTTIDSLRLENGLKGNDEYFKEFSVGKRYDTKEVAFIKKFLQKGLSTDLRKKILDQLFQKHVSSDESEFSRELYMSIEQLKEMKRNGMHIGNHGFSHSWLDTLSSSEQEKEMDLSLKFLEEVGCDNNNWTICYPYGGYNESLLEIIKSKGCAIGLTLSVGIADLEKDNLLTLPRLDTNDLPKSGNAEPNEWTLKMLQN
ncbi:MAG: polysaccharide deacetylase family protein [Parcubacteria group bacterium]|nr:polysaccharide deacetylase family protein [Parcubacteria group bacterium]